MSGKIVVKPVVDPEKCISCGKCVDEVFCPAKVFTWVTVKGDKKAAATNPDVCFKCGMCQIYCPTEAVHLGGYMDWLDDVTGPDTLYRHCIREPWQYDEGTRQ